MSDSRSRAAAYSSSDPVQVRPLSDLKQKSIEELGLYEWGEFKRTSPPITPIIKTGNLEGGQKVAAKNAF